MEKEFCPNCLDGFIVRFRCDSCGHEFNVRPSINHFKKRKKVIRIAVPSKEDEAHLKTFRTGTWNMKFGKVPRRTI